MCIRDRLLKVSRRICGIPDFLGYYDLSDGIRELLKRIDKGLLRGALSHRRMLPYQFSLFNP